LDRDRDQTVATRQSSCGLRVNLTPAGPVVVSPPCFCWSAGQVTLIVTTLTPASIT
jgi:hypothetical protein